MKERLSTRVIATGLILTVGSLAFSGCSETSDTTFTLGVGCPEGTDVAIGDIRNVSADNSYSDSATVEIGCSPESNGTSVAPENVEVIDGNRVVEVNDPSNEDLTRVEIEVTYDSSSLDWDPVRVHDPLISVTGNGNANTQSVGVHIEDIVSIDRVEVIS